MNLSHLRRSVPLTLTALILMVLATVVRAADAPFAGTWKVNLFENPVGISLCIVQISGTADAPKLRLVSALNSFKDAEVSGVKIDDRAVRFTFKNKADANQQFIINAYAPKGGGKASELVGSLSLHGEASMVVLESTKDKEIDSKNPQVKVEGFDDLIKVESAKEDAEAEKILQAIMEKFGTRPVSYTAASIYLSIAAANKKATETELKTRAERFLKIADAYGPEMAVSADMQAARTLLSADKGAALAAVYAAKARENLRKTDSTAVTLGVLKVLSSALRKSGRAAETKPINAEVAKLDEELDKEFEKTAIPFKPGKFGGRKGKGDKVVMVELFTGAQCPPCVAANIAFDAAMKTYDYSEVVFLQYHLHVPGPDALTNLDGEARAKYYGLEGTPACYADGKATEPLGGGPNDGKDSYNELRKVLDAGVEKDAVAKVKLTVQRKGDKLDIKAEVSDLKKKSDKLKLRIALIEDVARYPAPTDNASTITSSAISQAASTG